MDLLVELMLQKERDENRRISQKRASEEAGVNYTYFYQVLHGYSSGKKSPEKFRKIANYFGMTDAELAIQWNRYYGKLHHG